MTYVGAGAAGGLVAVLALVGCGGGSPPSSAEAAAGQAEFRKVCATCHGLSAEGMPRLGKGLSRNEFVRGQSDAELVEFLKVGRPASHPLNERGVDMPPRGGNPALTDADLASIVAYLRTLQ